MQAIRLQKKYPQVRMMCATIGIIVHATLKLERGPPDIPGGDDAAHQ